MSLRDTIAAPATAPGQAAIGIVRVTGPEAFAVARRVCARWPEVVEPRRAFVTAFVRGGARFDQGLVLPFVGPASATGEDLVELHGHGGLANRLLLEALVAAGARVAEPGELTRRAFVAGKLDLAQAEAVAQVLSAQTERALRAAEAGLGGALSAEIAGLEAELTGLRGRVEGLLDFAAEADGAEAGLAEAIHALATRVRALAGTWTRGRRLFQRAEVVLAGPVNAGKSSLLNALCGEERALVDAAPGTTRDLVTADVELGGMPVRWVDTAGWRAATGVEARGIARGQAAAARADLVLWVTAGDADPEPRPDPAWLEVSTKSDLRRGPGLAVSARTGEGLTALRAAVVERLAGGEGESEVVVTAERQARALEEAAAALDAAAGQGALELVAEELAVAARALAAVRGRDADAGVLDAVFRQFCIGK